MHDGTEREIRIEAGLERAGLGKAWGCRDQVVTRAGGWAESCQMQ